MTKKRTHLLLEPGQHEALSQIAQREGRSLSDIAREIVQQGIEQRQQLYASEKRQRLQALERGRQVRRAILKDRGGVPLNLNISTLIEELRENRDDQIRQRGD